MCTSRARRWIVGLALGFGGEVADTLTLRTKKDFLSKFSSSISGRFFLSSGAF